MRSCELSAIPLFFKYVRMYETPSSTGFHLVFGAGRRHDTHMRIAQLLVLIGAACAAAPGLAADVAGTPAWIVVTGTGDPNLDIPAVQAAVDRGGNVLLRGHF